jgi:predicted GNAT superfamily acetyltransferase
MGHCDGPLPDTYCVLGSVCTDRHQLDLEHHEAPVSWRAATTEAAPAVFESGWSILKLKLKFNPMMI